MADPDRLQQLRLQRAKIAEHLAWLDQEIAQANKTTSTEANQPPLALRKVTPPPRQPVQLESNNPSPGLTADPEAVLEQWAEMDGDGGDKPISKTGCWIIFAAIAIIGVVGGLILIYTVWG